MQSLWLSSKASERGIRIPLGNSDFFSLSHNFDKTKNIFLHLIILGFQIDLKNSSAWSPKRVFRVTKQKDMGGVVPLQLHGHKLSIINSYHSLRQLLLRGLWLAAEFHAAQLLKAIGLLSLETADSKVFDFELKMAIEEWSVYPHSYNRENFFLRDRKQSKVSLLKTTLH